jgi:hypothetical protein
MDANLIINDIYSQEIDDSEETIDNTLKKIKDNIINLNNVKNKLEREYNANIMYKTYSKLKKEFPNNRIKISKNMSLITFDLDNSINCKFYLKIELPIYSDLNGTQYDVAPHPTNCSSYKELLELDINSTSYYSLDNLIIGITKCISDKSIGSRNRCTGENCQLHKISGSSWNLYDLIRARRLSLCM